MSGKSTICVKISQTLQNTPQLYVGNSITGLSGYAIDSSDYAHPIELPLAEGREDDAMWQRVTPYTLVFIDDMFNMPDAEHLYSRIVSKTPYVIGTGQIDPYNNEHWPIGKYLGDLIGPYATWEMNPLIDQDIARSSRSTWSLADRQKFNKETCAAVNADNWKFWSKDDA